MLSVVIKEQVLHFILPAERIHTRELGIPVHRLNLDPSVLIGEHEGIELAIVPPDDLRRRNIMKEYFIKNFYVHAPVPKRTQLLRTLETNGLLHAELGTSIVIVKYFKIKPRKIAEFQGKPSVLDVSL